MAVFTNVSKADATSLLEAYPQIGTLQALEGIAEGTENTNYKLTADSGNYILTLFEGRLDATRLQWYLDLQAHLKARGIPAPLTHTGTDGAQIRKVAGIPASVFEFLTGHATATPSPAQCKSAGAMLAAMHMAAADFEPRHPNLMDISTLRQMQGTIMADVPELPGPMMSLLQTLVDATIDLSKDLTALPDSLPRGVVHLDYFPDNVFFDGNAVSGVIDYFFAGTDCWAYDFAIALIAWGYEGPTGSLKPEHFAAMVQGYTAARQLSDDEVAWMPVFMRLAAARFLTTRLYDAVLPRKRGAGKPHNPLPMYRRLVHTRGIARWEDYPQA
ncbi:MAG: homoserine kinase [Proteobacteria bacterium]|nr:homoserine kinase [Pseudomonadota bacterium]